ncbi:hypothetical protein BX661DRAFT_188171 [Kickxella alabastrina]|uniref:uncharacterized protein n=1 Tax=Kickxella alabastrina TaxID=61397 RepID=UPI00221E576D|nr:uncharacterized protein BX661DRAFT_188171 [Kickxella alabastrina]KAI7821615.1 hypothetical protein BX661DRAFT_188171 [Kickxella alabastrina]
MYYYRRNSVFVAAIFAVSMLSTATVTAQIKNSTCPNLEGNFVCGSLSELYICNHGVYEKLSNCPAGMFCQDGSCNALTSVDVKADPAQSAGVTPQRSSAMTTVDSSSAPASASSSSSSSSYYKGNAVQSASLSELSDLGSDIEPTSLSAGKASSSILVSHSSSSRTSAKETLNISTIDSNKPDGLHKDSSAAAINQNSMTFATVVSSIIAAVLFSIL